MAGVLTDPPHLLLRLLQPSRCAQQLGPAPAPLHPLHPEHGLPPLPLSLHLALLQALLLVLLHPQPALVLVLQCPHQQVQLVHPLMCCCLPGLWPSPGGRLTRRRSLLARLLG